MTDKPEPRYLTAEDVADLIQIPRQKVYQVLKDGGVACYRIGRRVRYSAREVDRWLSAQKERA